MVSSLLESPNEHGVLVILYNVYYIYNDFYIYNELYIMIFFISLMILITDLFLLLIFTFSLYY